MQIRSLSLLTFALPLLAALALPPAVPAAPAPDCAAALRIALPNAHITTATAVPTNDSLRALGQRPYCRVEATVDAETHIVALLPNDWNGRVLMGGAGGYVGAVQNQFESTAHEGYATVVWRRGAMCEHARRRYAGRAGP